MTTAFWIAPRIIVLLMQYALQHELLLSILVFNHIYHTLFLAMIHLHLLLPLPLLLLLPLPLTMDNSITTYQLLLPNNLLLLPLFLLLEGVGVGVDVDVDNSITTNPM